jgi:microcystin-dependent protein
MSTPYIGEIIMFGGNFAIAGWAFCNGQLVSIAQESTLFALLGTTYGGDGQTTFALPNLQSRVALHQGQGPSLANYVIGQSSGTETVTLTSNQIPAHIHQPVVNLVDGTVDAPAVTVMPAKPKQAAGGNSATLYTDPTKTPVAGDLKPMQANLLTPAGSSQPHDNVMPFLVVNFQIALQGIFPSQN